MLYGTSLNMYNVLDYESSLLTNFNTPCLQYHFVCLHSHLACAQDVFQGMINQTPDHCDGMIGIVDDIVIHRKDDEEYDRCFHKLMEVACEHGLLYSGGKCVVKQPSVTLFACVYYKDWAHPACDKVSVMQNIPPPKTSTQLQMLFGMVTYLSPFVPSLPSFSAPLHELLKKCTEFKWNQSCQEAFDTMKSLVCTDSTLRYFIVCKPISQSR